VFDGTCPPVRAIYMGLTPLGTPGTGASLERDAAQPTAA
jgi:hypothetical protein